MVSGTENPVVVIKKFNFLQNESTKNRAAGSVPHLLQATGKFAYHTAMKSNTHNP
jgi:hypothetical protein